MSDLVLFAIDLDQVLQIVVFLIIIVSSLAGQFFKGNADRKNRPRPVKPAKAAKPVADPDRSRLETEIEAMLRRAIGAETQEKTAPDPVVHREPASVHREAARPVTRPKPVVPISAELIEIAPREEHESVAEHVNRHLKSDRMKRRPRRLSAEIDRADERLESRLHKTFDHKLGQLDSASSSTNLASSSIRDQEVGGARGLSRDADAGSLATRVVEMLRSPDDLPAAVVLSEILRRPDW